jgi:hypothetical protein
MLADSAIQSNFVVDIVRIPQRTCRRRGIANTRVVSDVSYVRECAQLLHIAQSVGARVVLRPFGSSKEVQANSPPSVPTVNGESETPSLVYQSLFTLSAFLLRSSFFEVVFGTSRIDQLENISSQFNNRLKSSPTSLSIMRALPISRLSEGLAAGAK